MAKVIGYGKVTGEVTLVLTEEEAGALDALVGYGFEPFRDAFYEKLGKEKLGKAYLQPYEKGLKSLFETVRSGEGSVSHFLQQLKLARAVFNGKKEVV